MFFEICGELTAVETFAAGKSIRELPRLRGLYGKSVGGNERASPVVS